MNSITLTAEQARQLDQEGSTTFDVVSECGHDFAPDSEFFYDEAMGWMRTTVRGGMTLMSPLPVIPPLVVGEVYAVIEARYIEMECDGSCGADDGHTHGDYDYCHIGDAKVTHIDLQMKEGKLVWSDVKIEKVTK